MTTPATDTARTTAPRRRKRPINIIDACHDPKLFADWFRKGTWASWFVFLAAAFALPMTPEQLEVYRQCTGRETPPAGAVKEAWLICGRRSGKSFVLSCIAVYLACFFKYEQHLQPGERASILIIAQNVKAARTIFRYVRGLLLNVPMLAKMVEREVAEGIDLTNGITIEVHPASYRAVRGYTVAACLADELAVWPSDDAAEPDVEVLNAVRPAMLTIPNAMLLCASSPYAKKGALWDAYRENYGVADDDVLVWKAPTRFMNPTVSERYIERAYKKDAAAAASEYGAEFRTDVSSFIDPQVAAACVARGVKQRPPNAALDYFGFCDPSGGSADSMCLAIAHREGEAVHIDCVREIPSPFNPAAAVSELVAVLRQYRCGTVRGDRYASQWVVAEFEKHNVSYRHSPLPKSSLYVELLPRLNAKSVVLLDHERTINQLCNLERRVSRAGQDSIDHPKGAAHHDDCINACAGAAYCASGKYDEPGLLWGRYGTPDPQPRDLSHHNGPCVIVGADGSRNVGWATVKVQ